jgi:GT2 family glycosyltransferase
MDEKIVASLQYSILIVGFRSLRFLEEGIASLLASEGPAHEILFLDNASPEPEADWVESHFTDSRLRVFRSPKNLLFAGGMNYLAARARAPFLILLNPDARVARDWLSILDASRLETGFEAAQLDLREAANPERHETQGVYLDRLGFIRHVRRPEAVKPFRIFSGRGAGVMLGRARFEALGGLDEDMGMYFEETDYFWRLNLTGVQVYCVPGAKVYHVRGGSARKAGFDWTVFRFTRNRMLSLARNLELHNLLVYFPAHMLIYAGRIPLLLLCLRGRRAIAETAALGAALVMLPRFLAKRKALAKSRCISDGELIRQGLLLSPTKPVAEILKRLGFRVKPVGAS